ncbi:lactosylceramide 4-alpha-galactosyltransferase-like isoform X2 [Neocloeon triangulifer]|uniref:lactosylceramide 4-alpha-galactosyltransferase-like isoform X2 n=1 Tax=Neocloeon triangulifer TaxID=2078957 RepID=UPI00286F7D56|nr:lactosylceramide 4-alpha-galactosyltransferase-like isoform X2 [Neocloeon triangulifer]
MRLPCRLLDVLSFLIPLVIVATFILVQEQWQRRKAPLNAALVNMTESTMLTLQDLTPIVDSLAKLSPRQACTIESVARHSKGYTLVLLYVHPVRLIKLRENVALYELLKAHGNIIKVFTINAPHFLTKLTPFGTTAKAMLEVSPFRANHLSDFLRLSLVLKFGGFYMDLDVLVYRDLTDLLKLDNFLLTRTNETIGSYFFGFQRGNPMIKKLIDQVISDYVPQYYAVVPNSMGGAFIGKYNTSVGAVLAKKGKLDDVLILNSTLFSPLGDWVTYPDLFNENKTHLAEDFPKISYGVHIWSYQSGRKTVYLNSTSPIAKLAKDHCPRSFETSRIFGSFK